MLELGLETSHQVALVAAAASDSYRRHGQEVLADVAPCADGAACFAQVFVPGLRRLERIETQGSLESTDLAEYTRHMREGFDVWVVVPLPYMGLAHERLRGTVNKIQAWWPTEHGIRFGDPEIP